MGILDAAAGADADAGARAGAAGGCQKSIDIIVCPLHTEKEGLDSRLVWRVSVY